MKKKGNRIICLDPGNENSGLVEIFQGKIVSSGNFPNETAVQYILDKGKAGPLLVVYEDMQYYSVRMGRSIIDTSKFLGQLEWRLSAAGIKFTGIYRWEVKKWVYENFKSLCETRILQKIERKRVSKKAADKLRVGFVFVDDRIVLAAMKEHWKIPTPKPGHKSLYDLARHSWQALALGTVYLSRE